VSQPRCQARWILGIRPTLAGLCIAPDIPTSWPGFSAKRVFRGVTYHISVERAGSGNSVALTVDGLPVVGNLAPLPTSGQIEAHVKATLS